MKFSAKHILSQKSLQIFSSILLSKKSPDDRIISLLKLNR